MVASFRNANSHSSKDGFFDYVKKHWIYIIAMILIVPYLYRYLVGQVQKSKVQNNEIIGENQVIENLNPETRQNRADKITLNKGVQNAAADLAHHLGTKYSDTGNWYDFLNPRGWTENDDKVLEILKYQVRNYHLLEKLYFEVYSKRRNLKDDVNKLLDVKQLVQLKEYYKKYIKVW
jgi:hypothetical protein